MPGVCVIGHSARRGNTRAREGVLFALVQAPARTAGEAEGANGPLW
ncbi:hypothetical protein [Thermosulfurimonas sp. F29]|nr:hypothetical protein [Thermosulfurimonas sp. F29]MBX6424068.1 hypothetical protein [Thermosulfurimonas sp. F29]